MSLLNRSISLDQLNIQRQPLKERSLFEFIYRSASENDLVIDSLPRSGSSVIYESSLNKLPDFLIGYPSESDESEIDSSSCVLGYLPKAQSVVLYGPSVTVVSRLQAQDQKMQAKARESWTEKLVPDLGSFTSVTSSETCSDVRRSPTPTRLRRSQSLGHIPAMKGREDDQETGEEIFGINGERARHHRRTLFAVRSWMDSLPAPDELVGSEC